MLVLKCLLIGLGFAWFAASIGMLMTSLFDLRKRHAGATEIPGVSGPPLKLRRRAPLRMMLLGCLPVLLGMSISLVPTGMAGVRISQISGTPPGTLHPALGENDL